MTIVLDGKSLAKSTEEDIANRVKSLKGKRDITPVLATILVGSDPASATYVQ